MREPTHQDVFRETLRVCQPHMKDVAVAACLAQAEEAMVRGVPLAALRFCLTAARMSGEAEARRRRLAM